MWLAHVRSFVARHRALYWSSVVCLMLVVGLTLLTQSRGVVQARAAWGTSVDVWVSRADTLPGQPITAQQRAMPAAMVPGSAVTAAPPAGSIARQHVADGEIVVAADIGVGRLPLLPAGWRAVAIAADDTTIALAVGDHVDVVAGGNVVSADGVVVDVQPGAVTIGVVAAGAPVVAAAALDRSAVVVVRPG